MNSSTTNRFWKSYAQLPSNIRAQAKKTFKTFLSDPYHPSLHYKKVHSSRPIFSVRITKDYRAVGIVDGDEIVWFWIGSHAEYEEILKQLRKKPK